MNYTMKNGIIFIPSKFLVIIQIKLLVIIMNKVTNDKKSEKNKEMPEKQRRQFLRKLAIASVVVPVATTLIDSKTNISNAS